MERARERCMRDRELVVSQGGLAIIGTERHESRRIDNQLRGRSGRQGDPGSSRFYVSMQDELMRLFGPERFDFFLRTWEENEPIEAKLISKQIAGAQKKVEGHHFESRQHVLKYDDVMNLQREVIYKQRRQVLNGEDMRSTVMESIQKAITKRVSEFAGEALPPPQWDIEKLSRSLLEVCPQLPLFCVPEEMRTGPANPLFEAQHRARLWQMYEDSLRAYNRYDDLLDGVLDHVEEAYVYHEAEQGEENTRMVERFVILRIIDNKWIHHLDAMSFLMEGIGLRGYEQIDPLMAYTKEGYAMWENLILDIQEEVAHNIFRVRLVNEEEEHRRAAHKRPVQQASGQSEEGPSRGDRVAHSSVGRNDPVPLRQREKIQEVLYE